MNVFNENGSFLIIPKKCTLFFNYIIMKGLFCVNLWLTFSYFQPLSQHCLQCRFTLITNISVYENRALKMKYFWSQGTFFNEFWFQNGCKNEFKDNTEKSCIWSRNRVSHKIDFKAVWPRNGHADSVGDKLYLSTSRKLFRKLFLDFVFFLRQLKFDPVGKKVFGSSRCFRLWILHFDKIHESGSKNNKIQPVCKTWNKIH